MVLADRVDDPAVEFAAQCKIDPFLHVGEDHQRTHAGSKFVMGIDPGRDVFAEILRLHQFADIMKISTHPAERGIRAGLLGAGLGQIRDCQ